MKPPRPRSDSYWNSERTVVPSATVLEETDDYKPTGLLDRNGLPLVRVKPPVGFVDFSKLPRRR